MGLALVILSPFFFLLFEGLDGTGAFEDKPIPSPTIPGVPELQEEETFNNDTGTIGYYYPAEFNVVDVEDSDDADDFQIFNFSGNSMERIGALCFMLCVGGGLCLIIFNAVKLSKYKKMNSEIFSLAYGVEGIISKRKSENESAYNTCLTVGIVLCAVPILPVILEYLNIINRVSQSVVDFYGCASLVLLAVGAYLILSTCIIRNSYSKILQIGNYTPANKAAGKAGCSKFGFYWLFVGVIFLAISYFFKSWEKSWLLWPLAVVIFIFLNQIFGVVEKKD